MKGSGGRKTHKDIRDEGRGGSGVRRSFLRRMSEFPKNRLFCAVSGKRSWPSGGVFPWDGVGYIDVAHGPLAEKRVKEL